MPAGQGDPEPVTPVLPTPAPPTETSVFPPIDADHAPSLGSDWSGFPDDLCEPFPDLFSEVGPAPPVSTLNPSQKNGLSPESLPRVGTAEASPSPVPTAASALPGFTAEQMASLKLLLQSCLPAPTPSAPAHRSPTSASLISLPAPPLPATIASETPRSGPSWELEPPLLEPRPGPSGVRASTAIDPRPGPSWELDRPLFEPPYNTDESPELVVLSDSEESDAVTPPVGSSLLDPLHLAAAEELDRLWHETPAAISTIPIPPRAQRSH